MAPRRKRTKTQARGSLVPRPGQRQSSITSYFSVQDSAHSTDNSPLGPSPRGQVGPPLPERPPLSSPRIPLRNRPPLSSGSFRSRASRWSTPPRNSSAASVSLSPASVQKSASRSPGKESLVMETIVLSDSSPTADKTKSAERPIDVGVIDPSPIADNTKSLEQPVAVEVIDDDLPMTQEEEVVHEQLRSLCCSRESAEVRATDTVAARDTEKFNASVAAALSDLDVVMTDAKATESNDKISSDAGDNCHAEAPASRGAKERGPEGHFSVKSLSATPASSPSEHAEGPVKKTRSAESPVLPCFSSEPSSGDEPSPSPRTPASSSLGGDDSDDDTALLEAAITGPRRSLRQTRNAPDRYQPGVESGPSGGNVFGDSVFGTSVFGVHLGSRAPSLALQREQERYLAKEKKLDELRKEVMATQQASASRLPGENSSREQDKEIRDIAKMAAADERRHAEDVEAYEMYIRPEPLFIRAPTPYSERAADWEVIPPNVMGIHPMHQLLVEARRCARAGIDMGNLLCPVMFEGFGVQPHYYENHPVNLAIVRMLFGLAAHDVSSDSRFGETCVQDTGSLCDTLCKFLRNQPSAARALEPLEAFLGYYGAAFSKSSVEISMGSRPGGSDEDAALKTAGLNEKSLDYDVTASKDTALRPETLRAIRNLRRGFVIYACAVDCGMDLGLLAGSTTTSRDTHSTSRRSSKRQSVQPARSDGRDAEDAIALVKVCGRVMLSPLGSELRDEVGDLLASVLNRVDDAVWPSFRLRAAGSLAVLSSRLHALVDLATYGLPYHTMRSRHLQLDFAYVCLQSWCKEPITREFIAASASAKPSNEARRLGIEGLSYCLPDIVAILDSLPELSKRTDAMWASAIARLLKQAVADEDVLTRRNEGDLEKLEGFLKELRKRSHWLGGDIPVQIMRLALDALRCFVALYSGVDRDAFAELNPQKRGKKKQVTMSHILSSLKAS